MIDVACPRDGTVHHADEMHIGRMLRCSRCGDPIPILDPRRPFNSSQSPLEPIQDVVSPIPRDELTRKNKRRFRLWAAASFAVIVFAGIAGLRLHLQNKRSAPDLPIDLSAGMVNASTGPPKAPSRPDVFDEAARQPNSLPTGTRLSRDSALGGHGTLTITNGSSLDAVVNLADSSTDRLVRSVYIQADSVYTLRNMRPGSYRMIFAQGSDWDSHQDCFRSDPSYFEFGNVLDFQEKRDNDSIHYQALRVTLNNVVGGNVQRIAIGPDEFNRLFAQRDQF